MLTFSASFFRSRHCRPDLDLNHFSLGSIQASLALSCSPRVHVKQLVTFRMEPKRSTSKGKGKESKSTIPAGKDGEKVRVCLVWSHTPPCHNYGCHTHKAAAWFSAQTLFRHINAGQISPHTVAAKNSFIKCGEGLHGVARYGLQPSSP